MLKEIIRLIWSLQCVGCDTFDEHICTKCRTYISENLQPEIVEKADGDLFVVSSLKYKGPVRNLVLGWKDHGRTDINWYVSKIICSNLGVTLEKLFPLGDRDDGKDSARKQTPIYIIPAPSSKKSQKRRRFLQTDILANAIIKELNHQGLKAKKCKALKQTHSKKQVNFSATQRQINKANTLKSVGKAKQLTGAKVIIVDDICTTGSTLFECTKIVKRRHPKSTVAVALCCT